MSRVDTNWLNMTAADIQSSSSSVNQFISGKYDSVVTTQQQLSLTNLRHWLNTEAEFHGRTDEEFLLLFLRGCKFNEENAKKKLIKFYEVRKNVPQWWTNRDLRDRNVLEILQQMTTTAIMGKDPSQPAVVFTISSRFPSNMDQFDDYLKCSTIFAEVAMRHRSCQMNGAIAVVDCRAYPKNLLTRVLAISFVKNFLNSFAFSQPVRIKGIHFLNSSSVVVAFYKLIRPFFSKKMKKRVHFYGSNLSSLSDHVPIDLIPEEYGGNAGPLKQHCDAFLKEVLSYADYIADDGQYGFQANTVCKKKMMADNLRRPH